MPNVLSIDVEDWYQTHDFDIAVGEWDRYQDRVQSSTYKCLQLLERNQVKATFFVLGHVAAKHPALIREIAAAGHEIGSHSYWHQLVTRQTPEQFRQDVIRSKNTLEDIIGEQITLYRAPSWSITGETLWALEILDRLGFAGDSSVQPFVTPLSGMSGAPTEPYHPMVGGRKLRLIEFPPTVLATTPWRFPFAGGFYFRAMPSSVVTWALETVNKERSALLYCHPWELDDEQPRLAVAPHLRLIHYLNLSSMERKLELVLQRFTFTTLGELLKSSRYPVLRIDGEDVSAG